MFAIALFSFGAIYPPCATAAEPAAIISELIRPAKLATLGSRGANPRVQKCVYWLAVVRRENQNPTNILDIAVARAGYSAPAARLTREALLRNLDIAGKLGCLDSAGLADMRRGRSPTIRKGPCAGDELSVDHIIPRAVCPELDNVIANLELMPMRLNSEKSDKVGERQLSLARRFLGAGLLTHGGLEKIQAASLRQATSAFLKHTMLKRSFIPHDIGPFAHEASAFHASRCERFRIAAIAQPRLLDQQIV